MCFETKWEHECEKKQKCLKENIVYKIEWCCHFSIQCLEQIWMRLYLAGHTYTHTQSSFYTHLDRNKCKIVFVTSAPNLLHLQVIQSASSELSQNWIKGHQKILRNPTNTET